MYFFFLERAIYLLFVVVVVVGLFLQRKIFLNNVDVDVAVLFITITIIGWMIVVFFLVNLMVVPVGRSVKSERPTGPSGGGRQGMASVGRRRRRR